MYESKLPKVFRPFECSTLYRLGKKNDGGYLVNLEDVYATKILVSAGIGTDISFEQDFISYNNCSLVAYDREVEIDKEFFKHNKKFYKEYIERDSLESIFKNNKNIFLKCDIEGNEYNFLDIIINNSDKLTGMIFEFHSVTEGNNFNLLTEFISKIKQKLVHIHVNNYFYYKTEKGNIPDILELTFTSSKNIIFNLDLKLPHVLDMTNNPNDREFKITF